jgi:His-Xaa-Ser system protein HxsD
MENTPTPRQHAARDATFLVNTPTEQPDSGGNSTGVMLTVDLETYGMGPLLRTAHQFTGRCFVQLQNRQGHLITVALHSMNGQVSRNQLEGEFMNALLDHTLRERIARETEGVRNLILAHALSRTSLIAAPLEQDTPQDKYVSNVGRA